MAGLDEPEGRFANQARYVTGSEAAVNYPASSPPWHAQADPGVEPINSTLQKLLINAGLRLHQVRVHQLLCK
jgi:hypothetical protein